MGQAHACCNQQCNGISNALPTFPFSAWDDVSGGKLDPAEVIEIGYAEKEPVWVKIPRRVAKSKGWEIQSRWIDVNKGDDDNPIYRSRMVGMSSSIRQSMASSPPRQLLKL